MGISARLLFWIDISRANQRDVLVAQRHIRKTSVIREAAWLLEGALHLFIHGYGECAFVS